MELKINKNNKYKINLFKPLTKRMQTHMIKNM